jgi:hypothetical protein
MTHHLRRPSHLDGSTTVIVLEVGVDPFGAAALVVADIFSQPIADDVAPRRIRSSERILGLRRPRRTIGCEARRRVTTGVARPPQRRSEARRSLSTALLRRESYPGPRALRFQGEGASSTAAPPPQNAVGGLGSRFQVIQNIEDVGSGLKGLGVGLVGALSLHHARQLGGQIDCGVLE